MRVLSNRRSQLALASLLIGLLGFPAVMTLKHAFSSRQMAISNSQSSNNENRPRFQFEDLPEHHRQYKFEDEADEFEDTPFFGIQRHDAKYFEVLLEKELDVSDSKKEDSSQHHLLRIGQAKAEAEKPKCPDEENTYYVHQVYPCSVDFFCDWQETPFIIKGCGCGCRGNYY